MEKKACIISIVMESESDLGVMQEAQAVLTRFDIRHEIRVISAHHTPAKANDYAMELEDRGVKIVISSAGEAKHLAGLIAGITLLPVIGVPITTPGFGGLDSLFATVQMPNGIPVATVPLGRTGAKNAALLAIEILALNDPGIRNKLAAFREEMSREVERADERVG